jgi:hypothetical protein
MIKDFKAGNLKLFEFTHCQTLNLLTPNIPYLPPFLYRIKALEALGEGLQMFFELQKQRNNV